MADLDSRKASRLGDALRQACKDRGFTGKNLAARIFVDPAYVSRAITGAQLLSLDTLKAAAQELGTDYKDLLEAGGYTEEEYRSRHLRPSRGQLTTSLVAPPLWDSILEHLIAHGATQHPESAAQYAQSLASDFQRQARMTSSATYRTDLERLAGLAQLVNVWSQINYLPTSRFGELTQAIDEVFSEGCRDAEISAFGTELLVQADRMRYGRPGDLDRLESVVAQAEVARPVIAGLFFEELAKQQMISEEHSLQHIAAAIENGRTALSRDDRINWRLVRFDDVQSRATWLKSRDPRSGASQMSEVVRTLRSSQLPDKNMLVRTMTYEALMKVDIGESAGIDDLASAYRLAQEIHLSYFEELVETEARKFGIDVSHQQCSHRS